MSIKFKKGDRVECINGKGFTTDYFDLEELEEGKIYIIEEAYCDGVRLEGYPFIYNSSRFKLAENAKPAERNTDLEQFLRENPSLRLFI